MSDPSETAPGEATSPEEGTEGATVQPQDDTTGETQETAPGEQSREEESEVITTQQPEQVAPTAEEVISAEQDTAPIEQEATLAEQEAVPAEQEAVPAEQEDVPAEQEATPAEEEAVPAEQEAGATEEEVAPAAELPTDQAEQEESENPTPASGEPSALPSDDASATVQASTEDAPEPSQDAGEEQGDDAQGDETSRTSEVTTEAVAMGTDPTTEPEPEVDPHAPSPDMSQMKYATDATATVKFVMMPSGQVATLRCHLGQILNDLRNHFSGELKMPADVLLLLFDGKTMDENTTLGDLGVGPNGTVRLEIQSSDPINSPLKAFKPQQEYHMPDVITVRVQTDEGEFKDVVVEIERSMRKKPFLGGYKHKKTSFEFHHASAQTSQKQKSGSKVEKYCRDTQTSQQRNNFQQTTNSTSTQMTKIGVFVANLPDKLMVPGKYTTADEHHKRILDQVVVIQKYYRRWLARRYVGQVRVDKSRRQEWERDEEIRKRKEKEERIKREFERRMNPKTKEDFDLLYHALEKWRHEEVNRINVELTGAERKAALCQLLEQETQLIASVGRHKLEADAGNQNIVVQKFLDKAAAPKRWRGPDGKMTEMDTPYTIRAQQLRDIYNSINMKYLTQDERLDVLLTLKHTVKEHDCKLTQEIIELIDREADLLMRGIKEGNLEGLRKRISTLFLQYIKTPTFNPEAARLIKVPQDPTVLRKNIYFCSSCNQYLQSTEFQMSSNSRAVGKCRSCNKTDNDARVRQDYSHYRFLLKNLRRAEELYGDGSKIAFLLQENDLRHLVENVWNSQSILSAWDDLYDLTLVRWIRTEEWSPWNCILLTKEEASAHEKLEDLEEAYGKVFIHRVQHKHTLARNYFSRLPGMAEHMRVRAESSSLSGRQGPSVSGKRITPLQGSAIKAQ